MFTKRAFWNANVIFFSFVCLFACKVRAVLENWSIKVKSEIVLYNL